MQSSNLEILMTRFQGQVLIPFIPAAVSIGISGQTARNRLVMGKFPVRTVLNGARRFIHIHDLANYLDALQGQPIPGRRGRPRKSEKFAQQQEV